MLLCEIGTVHPHVEWGSKSWVLGVQSHHLVYFLLCCLGEEVVDHIVSHLLIRSVDI